MRAGIPLLLVLASCSQAGDSDSVVDAPAPLNWSNDFRAFCEAAQPRWLADNLDRIDRALPEDIEPGSLRFEALNLQSPFDGRKDAMEVQFRLTAKRGEAPIALSAYGLAIPDQCDLDDFHAIEGFDRSDPPLKFSVEP